MIFFHQAKWDSSKPEGKLLYPSFFHRFFVNSNFSLLGVGAEKSSLYRLGFMGFDAYLIILQIKGEGLRKELFSPFAGLLVRSPAL